MATKRHKEVICAFMCILCLFVAKSSAQVWNVWVSEYEPNSAKNYYSRPLLKYNSNSQGFFSFPTRVSFECIRPAGDE